MNTEVHMNERKRLEIILADLPLVSPGVEKLLLAEFQKSLDALPPSHVLTKKMYILRLGEYFNDRMDGKYDKKRYV